MRFYACFFFFFLFLGQNPRKPIVKNMTVVNYIQPSLIWKGLTHTGYAVIL